MLGHYRREIARSWLAAAPVPDWPDQSAHPAPRPALGGSGRSRGGRRGVCGLLTALLAKERDPGRSVILLEADRVCWAATGRNGGFCAASLTQHLHAFTRGLELDAQAVTAAVTLPFHNGRTEGVNTERPR
jgi:hypothetical protein